MHNMLYLLALFIFLAFPAGDAYACKNFEKNTASQFYGRILYAQLENISEGLLDTLLPKALGGGKKYAHFRTLNTLKGEPLHSLVVSYTNDRTTNTHIIYEVGKKYLLFIKDAHADTLELESCTENGHIYQPTIEDPLLEELRRASESYRNVTRTLSGDWQAIYKKQASRISKPNNVLPWQRCDDQHAPEDGWPDFLRYFPSTTDSKEYPDHLTPNLKIYTRLAYKYGYYSHAVRAACLSHLQTLDQSLFRDLSLYRMGKYKKKASDFIQANTLQETDLHLDDIRGVSFDFSQSVLTNMTAINADISGSLFANTKLFNVDFKNARLSHSYFNNAIVTGNLEGVDLSGASLEGTDLSSSNISNANFSNAKISGVNFGGHAAHKIKDMRLEGAIFDVNTQWPVGINPLEKGAILKNNVLNIGRMQEASAIDGRDASDVPLQAGLYRIDGTHVKNMLTMNGKNNQRNIFIVNVDGMGGIPTTPGSTHIKKRQIKIVGDVGVDTVVLDGCYNWSVGPIGPSIGIKPPREAIRPGVPIQTPLVSARVYQPTPDSGVVASVFIEDGLTVSFASECAKNAITQDTTPAETSPPQAVRIYDDVKVAALLRKIRALEKYWKESTVPKLILTPEIRDSSPECPKGSKTFDTPGTYNVEIPKGCKQALVKIWAAGGTGRTGHAGSYTTGIIDLDEDAAVTVTVGHKAQKETGSEATSAPSNSELSSSVSINGHPVAVAQNGTAPSLAPQYGLSVSSAGGRTSETPNTGDPYYLPHAGRVGQHGLSVILWPAPDVEDFLQAAVLEAPDDEKVFLQTQKMQNEARRPVSENIPENYRPKNAMNRSVYKKWISDMPSALHEPFLRLIHFMDLGLLPTEFIHQVAGADRRDIYTMAPLDLRVNNPLVVQTDKHSVFKFPTHTTIHLLKEGWGDIELGDACVPLNTEAPIYIPSTSYAFGGIGISLQKRGKKFFISNILETKPAQRAGLLAGDEIFAINDSTLDGTSMTQVLDMLQGPIGETVKITYIRYNKLASVELERAYMEQILANNNETFKTARAHKHKYFNFIAFDGIDSASMEWKSESILVNKKTGDTLRFPSGACYNLIFPQMLLHSTTPPFP